MHGVLWSRLGGHYDQPPEKPPDKPLTLAAYSAAGAVTCYVEPTAVGTSLIDMPLFLTPDRYVNVPLEKTYLAAYDGLPQRWKRVIMATMTIRIPDAKHDRLRRLAESQGISLNKLVDEWASMALAQFDAETRFNARAASGNARRGLALLDKLDQALDAPRTVGKMRQAKK